MMSPSARPTIATGVALTFDDGPDPLGTPAVLAALRRADARATFFVTGPNAQAHPELIARAADDGHAIALHCDAHVRHTERDRAWVRADCERALTRLRGLGVRPRLWRPPWGVTAPWSAQLAAEVGLELVGWDVDTHDWRGDGARSMLRATAPRLRPGTIVLAHDGIGPGARRGHCRESAAYVDLVAGHVARHGLGLVALEA